MCSLALLSTFTILKDTSNKYLIHLLGTFFSSFHIDQKNVYRNCTEQTDSYGIKGHVHLMQNRTQSKWCKFQCNTHTLLVCFFLIQITDYKNINEIFHMPWSSAENTWLQWFSARLYSSRPQPFWCWLTERNTVHAHARTYTHSRTHTYTESVRWTSKDETKWNRNNIQRASGRLRDLYKSCFFFVVFLVFELYISQLIQPTESSRDGGTMAAHCNRSLRD